MSREKINVDDKHYREVDENGETSYLFERTGMLTPDICVEVAEHHKDGTTTPYEYDPSLSNFMLGNGCRGAKK